jgi:hypothetical protein
MKSDLRIDIGPSNSLRLVLGFMLVLSIASVSSLIFINLAWLLVCLPILFLTFGLYFRQMKRIFFRNSRWELSVSQDFSIQLSERGPADKLKSTRSVIILRSSKVWSFFISLHIQDEAGKRIYISVLPDALSHADFRRLKVLVRFSRLSFASNILALDQL